MIFQSSREMLSQFFDENQDHEYIDEMSSFLTKIIFSAIGIDEKEEL